MSSQIIQTLGELVELPLQMQSMENFQELCWWRGHGDKKWSLTPSVFRRSTERGLGYEASILRWFMSRASLRHEKLPSSEDYFGWLSLAQHYRLPTRLLDWSQSILVATYFAVTESKNSDGAIWCLHPSGFNEQWLGEFGLADPTHPVGILYQAFLAFVMPNGISMLTKEAQEYSKTLTYGAVVPTHNDLRMLQQLAMFTIHHKPEGLDLQDNHDAYLRKFIIPKESKHTIRLGLESLGINALSLFPDLESMGKYLAEADFGYLDKKR